MNKKRHWIINGLYFGLAMLIFTTLWDVFSKDFTWQDYWKKALIWLAGGLLFGFINKFIGKK